MHEKDDEDLVRIHEIWYKSKTCRPKDARFFLLEIQKIHVQVHYEGYN